MTVRTLAHTRSGNHQHRTPRIIKKRANAINVIAQHRSRFVHAAIAASKPDYFWRRTQTQADL